MQQKDKTWRPDIDLKKLGIDCQGGLYRRNRQQMGHRYARLQSFEPSNGSPTGDIKMIRDIQISIARHVFIHA